MLIDCLLNISSSKGKLKSSLEETLSFFNRLGKVEKLFVKNSGNKKLSVQSVQFKILLNDNNALFPYGLF
jgi:hypothetical protein